MKNLLVLASSVLALVSCQASLGNGPLDGRVYEVSLVGPDAKPQPDRLIFDGGRFASTACRAHGIYGGAYSASGESFEAAPKSATSTTTWNGTLSGDAIEGTMKRTDRTGKTDEFRFSGRKAMGLLDGRTFEGRICEAGKTSGDPDRLLFAHGGFDSQACRAYGFTITSYAATREGDVIRFSADATNADGETNRWEGVALGDKLTGTMKHASAKGHVTGEYDFEATVVK
jgi:hypothetical protein